MAENGASANGHRPARRRKHIYPPLEQMAAEQATAAARPRAARSGPMGGGAAGADQAPDLAPARRRKHVYPPLEQMAAEQAAAAARARNGQPGPADDADAEPELAGRPEFGPEPEAPPAPPVMAASLDDAAAVALLDPDDLAEADVDRVELRLSAVGMVDAGDVQLANGALGAARADTVSVDRGAIGAALADRVEVSRGYARSIIARHVQMDSAAARVIVAADVKAERTAVMFLFARRVSGDVRVLVDWRGALAFGAVAGLVMGLLRRRPGGGKAKGRS